MRNTEKIFPIELHRQTYQPLPLLLPTRNHAMYPWHGICWVVMWFTLNTFPTLRHLCVRHAFRCVLYAHIPHHRRMAWLSSARCGVCYNRGRLKMPYQYKKQSYTDTHTHVCECGHRRPNRIPWHRRVVPVNKVRSLTATLRHACRATLRCHTNECRCLESQSQCTVFVCDIGRRLSLPLTIIYHSNPNPIPRPYNKSASRYTHR